VPGDVAVPLGEGRALPGPGAPHAAGEGARDLGVRGGVGSRGHVSQQDGHLTLGGGTVAPGVDEAGGEGVDRLDDGGSEVLHVAAEQRGTEVGGGAVEQPPRRQAVPPVAQVAAGEQQGALDAGGGERAEQGPVLVGSRCWRVVSSPATALVRSSSGSSESSRRNEGHVPSAMPRTKTASRSRPMAAASGATSTPWPKRPTRPVGASSSAATASRKAASVGRGSTSSRTTAGPGRRRCGGRRPPRARATSPRCARRRAAARAGAAWPQTGRPTTGRRRWRPPPTQLLHEGAEAGEGVDVVGAARCRSGLAHRRARDRWRPAARRGRRAWRASRRARRPPRQRATARPTAWRTPAATVAHGPAGDQGDQVPPAPAVGGEGEGGVQGAAGGGCRPAGWCPARCGGCRRPPAARAACGRTAPWSGTGSPSDRGGCRTRRAP
jgi:hypothetical protein